MKHNIRNILADVNGATFISIDTVTIPDLLGGKKNPLKGRVRKIMKGANVMVFQNKNLNGYQEMVRRRLIKEGKDPETFQLKPRRWGVRIDGTPFVEHKGNYYLEVIFLHTGETWYEVDGVKTNPEDIEGLRLDKKEGEQGGLSENNKVIIRTFKLESITRLVVNKHVYEGSFYYE